MSRGISPGIRKVTPPMGLAVAMGVAGESITSRRGSSLPSPTIRKAMATRRLTRGTCCPLPSEQERSVGAAHAGEQRCRAGSRCPRRGDYGPVPEAGVLRPFARALLAVASDVHAARRDPLEAGSSEPGSGLRMRHRGDPLGDRLGGRLRGPMWRHSQRTGSGVASAQVKCAFPPPVVNPDCMGGCS